ncbi:hypothetical protein F2P79_025783, partial [Pimephales promelas]
YQVVSSREQFSSEEDNAELRRHDMDRARYCQKRSYFLVSFQGYYHLSKRPWSP